MSLKYLNILLLSIIFIGCNRNKDIKVKITNKTKYTIQFDSPSKIQVSNEYENMQSIFLNSKIDTLKKIELYDQINGTITLFNQKPIIKIVSLGPGESRVYKIPQDYEIENFAQVYFFYIAEYKKLNKDITFEEYVKEMKESGFLVSSIVMNNQEILMNICLNNSIKLNDLAEYNFSEFLRNMRN